MWLLCVCVAVVWAPLVSLSLESCLVVKLRTVVCVAVAKKRSAPPSRCSSPCITPSRTLKVSLRALRCAFHTHNISSFLHVYIYIYHMLTFKNNNNNDNFILSVSNICFFNPVFRNLIIFLCISFSRATIFYCSVFVALNIWMSSITDG